MLVLGDYLYLVGRLYLLLVAVNVQSVPQLQNQLIYLVGEPVHGGLEADQKVEGNYDREAHGGDCLDDCIVHAVPP